jgi:hypothetical protein
MGVVNRGSKDETIAFLRLFHNFVHYVVKNASAQLMANAARDAVAQWLVSDEHKLGFDPFLAQGLSDRAERGERAAIVS